MLSYVISDSSLSKTPTSKTSTTTRFSLRFPRLCPAHNPFLAMSAPVEAEYVPELQGVHTAAPAGGNGAQGADGGSRTGYATYILVAIFNKLFLLNCTISHSLSPSLTPASFSPSLRLLPAVQWRQGGGAEAAHRGTRDTLGGCLTRTRTDSESRAARVTCPQITCMGLLGSGSAPGHACAPAEPA